MILGVPGKLSSQFRLTYNMILNLLRVEALKVEEMIKRSFSENASQRLLPEQQIQVIESEKQLGLLAKLECDICTPDIERFYDFSSALIEFKDTMIENSVGQRLGPKLLLGGRVVVLRDHHFKTNNLAVLLKAAPVQPTEAGKINKSKMYYVLAMVDEDTKSRRHDIDPQAVVPRWPPAVESLLVADPVYELTAVSATSITFVTNRVFKIDVEAIVDRHLISRMNQLLGWLQQLSQEWAGIGAIPEVEWRKTGKSLEFQDALKARIEAVEAAESLDCVHCPDFDTHYEMIHAEKMLRANIATLKLAISDQNLELIPDYEQRVEVLKELKFIDANQTVLLKGRVACEINSANELVLTELILENTLAVYEPEEVVALLSCFVFQEKTEIEPVLTPRLEVGRDAILAISDRVGRLQDKHRVPIEDFRSNPKFGLMEVVYEWAKGMPFEQITALTDIAEGTIVRVITRLDETCREVRDAARVIGDADLFKKMEEAQLKIKRDIVFAASLYF